MHFSHFPFPACTSFLIVVNHLQLTQVRGEHGKRTYILQTPWGILLLTSIQAFLLRQIVAGPRARHPEAKLDLCYVTDNSRHGDLNDSDC